MECFTKYGVGFCEMYKNLCIEDKKELTSEDVIWYTVHVGRLLGRLLFV